LGWGSLLEIAVKNSRLVSYEFGRILSLRCEDEDREVIDKTASAGASRINDAENLT
jgi:hypothetical protein